MRFDLVNGHQSAFFSKNFLLLLIAKYKKPISLYYHMFINWGSIRIWLDKFINNTEYFKVSVDFVIFLLS